MTDLRCPLCRHARAQLTVYDVVGVERRTLCTDCFLRWTRRTKQLRRLRNLLYPNATADPRDLAWLELARKSRPDPLPLPARLPRPAARTGNGRATHARHGPRPGRSLHQRPGGRRDPVGPAAHPIHSVPGHLRAPQSRVPSGCESLSSPNTQHPTPSTQHPAPNTQDPAPTPSSSLAKGSP